MKPVSKNISASLRGQREAGRSAISPTVSGTTKGVSMTVPGEGGSECPPGAQMQDRSAAKYADAVSPKFGGKKTT